MLQPMPHFHDPVTDAPVWLDRTQPLREVDSTLALLCVWRQAWPVHVRVDVYAWDWPGWACVAVWN